MSVNAPGNSHTFFLPLHRNAYVHLHGRAERMDSWWRSFFWCASVEFWAAAVRRRREDSVRYVWLIDNQTKWIYLRINPHVRDSLPVPESFVECFFVWVYERFGRLPRFGSRGNFSGMCVGMPEHVSAFRYGFGCVRLMRDLREGEDWNECVFIWCRILCPHERSSYRFGELLVDNEQK